MSLHTVPTNKCIIPYLDLYCSSKHLCHLCDIGDRYRKHKIDTLKDRSEIFLFDYLDVLPHTPKGGGSEYLYKPLIIKPEAMRRICLEPDPFKQIFIATDGAGMFSHNPGSQIDGYFLFDTSKIYTFGRLDFYGIPNKKAVEKYKEYFLIDLNKFM